MRLGFEAGVRVGVRVGVRLGIWLGVEVGVSGHREESGPVRVCDGGDGWEGLWRTVPTTAQRGARGARTGRARAAAMRSMVPPMPRKEPTRRGLRPNLYNRDQGRSDVLGIGAGVTSRRPEEWAVGVARVIQ